MRIIDIICPTWNNAEYLNPCVESIIKTGILNDMATLHIVNNGKQDIKGWLGDFPNIIVHDTGDNLGWEGGLDYALKRSNAPFVCFQNDDTFISKSSYKLYEQLLIPFCDANVAAVGPCTTVAAGLQSIYHPGSPRRLIQASYLIFFTVMVRRKYLDDVGGIDMTLPGGDDFDLCMRFNKAGKVCLINPDAFIIHHGFKTGTRVRGDHNIAGGWNSVEMSDRTNQALIRKHGFRHFIKTVQGLNYDLPSEPPLDLEGDVIRSYTGNGEIVLELACGGKKTIEKSIGVDWTEKGDAIQNVPGVFSVADIKADISQPLPFDDEYADTIIVRHGLEHMIDPVNVIHLWKKVLKKGGRLIIAVPDQDILNGIPLNPEHCHAYTQESLKNLMELCGFKCLGSKNCGNGVSFVGCYERII